MAVTSGTHYSVAMIKGDALFDGLLAALVLFTLSGTYAQADDSILAAVPTAIQNSRRNGRTVTIKDAMIWQAAQRSDTPGLLLGAKTLAVSGADITFELTAGATQNVLDLSTEFTNATAVPAQASPFGFLVLFTEA
jgi:hypothetical protein